MMDALFFGSIVVFFIAVVVHFLGITFKNDSMMKLALYIVIAGLVVLTAFLLMRGIAAGRVPLANQFEFATSFAWGIAALYVILRLKWRADWISTAALPSIFFMLSYAALLPREINDLMPALRSAWFTTHIGSAVISYAAFLLAGCAGVQYLLLLRKGLSPDKVQMREIDILSYRLIAVGILMLTVVILSGALWAEQAWSSFWTWDPKELWSLITWIVYSIYLHQRLRKNWQGKRMAIFAIIAVGIVLFTFVGVNTLLPGLHSYL